MRNYSPQYHFFLTKTLISHNSAHSNSVNSFCLCVALTSHPPPFGKKSQQSAFAQWPEGEKWQRDDMETEQVTAGGGVSTQRNNLHPCSPPPLPENNSQSPVVTSTRERPKTKHPSPLPGGFVPGMGEGSWEGDKVLSPFDPPPSAGCLRAWRWGRTECFRR